MLLDREVPRHTCHQCVRMLAASTHAAEMDLQRAVAGGAATGVAIPRDSPPLAPTRPCAALNCRCHHSHRCSKKGGGVELDPCKTVLHRQQWTGAGSRRRAGGAGRCSVATVHCLAQPTARLHSASSKMGGLASPEDNLRWLKKIDACRTGRTAPQKHPPAPHPPTWRPRGANSETCRTCSSTVPYPPTTPKGTGNEVPKGIKQKA